ncbi:MAG: Tol-Pal system beta propeller repeat protein TolB [Ancalomicrobiaceae bacterium]|nr:Tol-Pal system beta propeller repeat protein TolB [Ancalomicrobiaceae bacterium]
MTAETPSRFAAFVASRYRRARRIAGIPALGESLMRLALATIVLWLGLLSTPALALDVTIRPGQPFTPLPIAVPGFAGDPALAAQIAQIVANDLKLSGYINPLDPASYLDKVVGSEASPNFTNWATIGAQALVAGTVQTQGGQITAAVRLWDVTTSQQIFGQQFATTPDNIRRLGHIIADAVYSKLTGFKGFFDTRVVFVAESGPKTQRIKKLALMDWDGANVRFLTQGQELVLTPRFSPSTQQVAYMSFAQQGNPKVFILNTANGSRQLVGEFSGMTFSPRFSPDGSKLVFSVEHEGNSNIYVMDLATRQARQLTNDASINTSPCYSPDGSQIAFESDRGGAQQIYLMNADGSNQHRVTFGNGRYATPVFSPDPENPYIAFTKQDSTGFKIGVMKTDGSQERIIADGYHNEGPSWSPNGRYVMYFTDGGGATGGASIWFADVTGTVNMQVKTPGFASDPSWSPLLR